MSHFVIILFYLILNVFRAQTQLFLLRKSIRQGFVSLSILISVETTILAPTQYFELLVRRNHTQGRNWEGVGWGFNHNLSHRFTKFSLYYISDYFMKWNRAKNLEVLDECILYWYNRVFLFRPFALFAKELADKMSDGSC